MKIIKQVSGLLLEGKNKKDIYSLLKEEGKSPKELARLISQFPSPEKYRNERKKILFLAGISLLLFSYLIFLMLRSGPPFGFLGEFASIFAWCGLIGGILFYHRVLTYGLSTFMYLQVELGLASCVFSYFLVKDLFPLYQYLIPLLILSLLYFFFAFFLCKRLFYPHLFRRLQWHDEEPVFRE